ncbi:MAG: serine/threonine protein phosphatase, partial [Chitinophagaceae bacterium]
MARIIAIGDIHGALRALEQLLEMINPQVADKFIFLGDYVDGWPDSAQVISFLIKFSKKYHCIFIKGNHDVWCELWLNGNKADSIWLHHGGKATIESYKLIKDQDRHDHLEFFAKLENYFVDEDNRLHDAFRPACSQQHNTRHLCTGCSMTAHCCDPARKIRMLAAGLQSICSQLVF